MRTDAKRAPLSSEATAVVALTALAAFLRFASLDVQSFWSDEAVTVRLVRMDFDEMLTMISKAESTPPLYYVLAWPWTKLFGSGEIGLRSLSALAGTAAVPIAAAAASTLISRRAAVCAAALVAVHPLLVWYSQEARAYSLLVAFAALSLFLFARAQQDPTRGRLAAWSAASVLAFASHYFAVFVIVPEAVVLLTPPRRRAAVAVAGAVVGTAALAPLALAQRETGSADWIARSPLDSRIVNVLKQLLVGRAAPLDRPLAAVALLLLVLAVLLLLRRGHPGARRGAALAGGIGLAAIAAPIGLAVLGFDYLNSQNVVAAVIPLTVGVAAGFAVRTRVRLGLFAAGGLCLLWVSLVVAVALEPAYQRADWRAAARALAQPDGQRIVVLDNDFGGSFARIPFQLYLPQARAIDRGLARVSQRFPLRLRRRPEDRSSPDEVAAREIAFVNLAGESACGIGSRRALGSFFRVESHVAEGYSVLRYRSHEPVVIAPRAIADCLRDHELAILIQPRGAETTPRSLAALRARDG